MYLLSRTSEIIVSDAHALMTVLDPLISKDQYRDTTPYLNGCPNFDIFAKHFLEIRSDTEINGKTKIVLTAQ